MNRTEDLNVKLTKEEKELFIKTASDAGMTLSNYIRTLVLENSKYKIITKSQVTEK
jgi:uncharacterized protein (DUF1778 family)